VVISRYSHIRQLDWIAIPLLPYLYAVEDAEDVPYWADKASAEKLRKDYSDAHLGAPLTEHPPNQSFAVDQSRIPLNDNWQNYHLFEVRRNL
jgi:hypothetical protein